MRFSDAAMTSVKAIVAQPLRASLILIAMAIGVAAVVVLTALGESARRYITGEFASLGTNLIIVLPGRTETTGGQPPLFGETPRDLTLDDAYALLRSPYIDRIAPIAVGSAPVSFRGLERESNILGSTASLKPVRHLEIAQGRFLPQTDPYQAMPYCVIGQKVRRELFGKTRALGQWLRIGDRRFRVVGILGAKGQSIGMDLDETVIISVASAQALFNTASLFRVLADTQSKESVPKAVEAIRKIIKARHDGEEDVTIITQDSVVETFDKILAALTMTVAGIAAISLAVAGVLVMNVMLVSVSQRTAEIGLLKALGASSAQLRRLFLTEAALLSLFGALFGLGLGQGSVLLLQRIYPDFPIAVPVWALLAALGVAVTTGLLFGVWPAAKAARLDPIQALARR
ncbi:MAG: ABC transporter permease [Rhodobacteraceae bacterium]|nr:ABC transporter permease [Paracoccaceae bacterium]